MSVNIKHIFFNNLCQTIEYQKIKTLFIGTFNPGLPTVSTNTLTPDHDYIVKKIEQSPHFYNRPNNRFWGIIDRIYFPTYYQAGHQEAKRIDGLKHYKNINSLQETVNRQKNFCATNHIFITDIISEIVADDLDKIYNGFQDTILDTCVTIWNTKNILSIINQFNPERILFTFKPSSQIPNISSQVNKILLEFPDKTSFLMSPSGTTRKSYTELVDDWKAHLGYSN